MMDINFVLPIPTLCSLSLAKVVASMWKRSMERYCLPKMTKKNRQFRLNMMVNDVELQHRKAISKLYSVPDSFKSQMHDLDMQIATEVAVFFQCTTALNFVQLFMKELVFGMRGDVAYEASFRAALPFILDPQARYSIIVKMGLLDLLDNAWLDLRRTSKKHYFNLCQNQSDSMYQNINLQFIEIYFALFKMGRLDNLMVAVAGDGVRFRGSLANILFWKSFMNSSVETAMYSFGLMSVEEGLSAIVELTDRLRMWNRNFYNGPQRNRQVSIYTQCIADFSRRDLIGTIFNSVSCVTLISPWLHSCRYLPLASIVIEKLEDSFSADNYQSILHLFVFPFNNCPMRKSLLLNILDRFNPKFVTTIARGGIDPLFMLLCGLYGHDVTVKILTGGDDVALLQLRLSVCRMIQRRGIVGYNKFIEDVIPSESREEFIRLLPY